MFASNSVALQDSNSNFVPFQPMELLGQTMLYQRLLGCRGETCRDAFHRVFFVSWQRDFYWRTVLPVYTTTYSPLCNHRYPPCCWHGRSNESYCSVQYFRLTPHCMECCGELVFEREQAEEHRSALRTQGTLGAPRPHTVSNAWNSAWKITGTQQIFSEWTLPILKFWTCSQNTQGKGTGSLRNGDKTLPSLSLLFLSTVIPD